ncbi:hypothetical protein MAH1_33640 [Sessilibacter sp. MAH1]
MEYSDRLKYARKLRGLTQYELSEKSGISQQAISHIERGRNGVSVSTFHLARALSVDPEWLATGKGEPETKREYGNEKVPVIRGADVIGFINGDNVKPVSYLSHYHLEGESLFAINTTGIINFKNPLGQTANETLVVNYSPKAIAEQIENLEFLEPLRRIAVVDVQDAGVVPRVLTRTGKLIILEDPAGLTPSKTFSVNSDKILGMVTEIVTKIGSPAS